MSDGRHSHVFAEVFLTFGAAPSSTPSQTTTTQCRCACSDGAVPTTATSSPWIGHYRNMKECQKLVSFTIGHPLRRGISAAAGVPMSTTLPNEGGLHRRRRVTVWRVDLTVLVHTLCTIVERSVNWLIDGISYTHLSFDTVKALSTLLLSSHYIIHTIRHVLGLLHFVPWIDSWLQQTLLAIDVDLCWRLIAFGIGPTFGLVCGSLFVAALSFGTNTTEALLLSGLAGVLFMECLIPITFTVAFGMCLLDALSLADAATVTVVVWMAALCISRHLRNIIYTNVGLD